MRHLITTKTMVVTTGILLILIITFCQALPGASVTRYPKRTDSGEPVQLPGEARLYRIPGAPPGIALLNGLPADAQNLCGFDSAGFAALFATGRIAKNGLVKPANSFNFGGPIDPSCQFYSWAEQMFLWVTSPQPDSPGCSGGHVFDSHTFFDVSPPDSAGNRTLLPHEPGTVHAMNVFSQQKGAHDRPTRMSKSGEILETNPGEADNSVLLSRQGSLVYYSIMVNDVYAYLLTGLKNGAIIPIPDMFGNRIPHFPTTTDDLAQITGLARTKGTTLVDSNALALVLKASWVEASSLPDPHHYICVKADVPYYHKTSQDIWVYRGTRRRTLAMVGLHVVGSMPNHPELIWATFEHYKNTPNAGYSYVNTAGSTVNMPRNTDGNWLFCADSAAGPFNQAHMHMSSGNIQSNAPFHISASNTIRWKPFGNAVDFFPNFEDPDIAHVNTRIIALNNSVHRLLKPGDPREKYNFIGATWTFDGSDGNTDNGAGTKRLSNTTMETYQQGTDTLRTGGSCFSCHTGDINHSSHIFSATQPLFNLASSLAAEAVKAKQAGMDSLHFAVNRKGTMTLYPNPARDQLNMTVRSVAAGKGRIQIGDLQGRVLLQQEVVLQEGGSFFQVSVGQLSPGIYIVRLFSEQGRVSLSGRFVKQ